MNFLDVGPLELMVIVVVALVEPADGPAVGVLATILGMLGASLVYCALLAVGLVGLWPSAGVRLLLWVFAGVLTFRMYHLLWWIWRVDASWHG